MAKRMVLDLMSGLGVDASLIRSHMKGAAKGKLRAKAAEAAEPSAPATTPIAPATTPAATTPAATTPAATTPAATTPAATPERTPAQKREDELKAKGTGPEAIKIILMREGLVEPEETETLETEVLTGGESNAQGARQSIRDEAANRRRQAELERQRRQQQSKSGKD